MAYVLRNITREETEKLLQDAEKFDKSWRFPRRYIDKGTPIVVDEEKGYYLYKAVHIPMPDDYDRYYFYFRDVLYELCSHKFGRDQLLRLFDRIDPVLLPEFQQEIKAIFSIFNRHGNPLTADEEDDGWRNKINFDLDLATVNRGDDLALRP